MKKMFYTMVATTILATNSLLAMDGWENPPVSPPAKPLSTNCVPIEPVSTKPLSAKASSKNSSDEESSSEKSSSEEESSSEESSSEESFQPIALLKNLGGLPDQQEEGILKVKKLARLINSGTSLKKDIYRGMYSSRNEVEGVVYDIQLTRLGMGLMSSRVRTIHESALEDWKQEMGERTLGKLPLIDTQTIKWKELTEKDQRQKVLGRNQTIRFLQENSSLISEPFWGNAENSNDKNSNDENSKPIFTIKFVSTLQLRHELEIQQKKAHLFMDCQKTYEIAFQTIREWIASGRELSLGGWIVNINEAVHHFHLQIDKSLNLPDNVSIYFKFVKEHEKVYEKCHCFPMLRSSQMKEPEGYYVDDSRNYFAGYVIENKPVAFISLYKRYAEDLGF